MMSILSITLQNSCVPRPVFPTNPTACESSTITSASYFSARSQISSIRKIAVHRKNAVRRNQTVSRPAFFLQLFFEVIHIAVFKAKSVCFAKPHAVNNTRVIEFVGNNRVFFRQNCFKQPAVRVETRRVKNRVFDSQKLADLRSSSL